MHPLESIHHHGVVSKKIFNHTTVSPEAAPGRKVIPGNFPHNSQDFRLPHEQPFHGSYNHQNLLWRLELKCSGWGFVAVLEIDLYK